MTCGRNGKREPDGKTCTERGDTARPRAGETVDDIVNDAAPYRYDGEDIDDAVS